MKFDKHIQKKYRKSVEDAFDAILEHGNDLQKEIATDILKVKNACPRKAGERGEGFGCHRPY